MTSSNIGYEVVERKGNLDRSEFSICPNCSLHIIKLADGCSVCGWSNEKVLLGGDRKSPRKSDRQLSIPCLIKQPKQPELKGIIQKVWGDRFTVYIPSNGDTVTVSKLLVYPDFSKSVGQIPPTKQVTPPSKTRRKKGEGTGYIYRRTITRRGKQYRESYYRYRDESGKLRSKYIPQRLLDRVQEAESLKLPVTDVLKLLGGLEISRGEQFSTSDDGNVPSSDESPKGYHFAYDELISISRGEQASPPSTKNLKRAKRQQGYGAGYIECRKVKRGSKLYSQFWYHYEFWQGGDRMTKKSKYIPKRLVPKVERMNGNKVPVAEILKILNSKK